MAGKRGVGRKKLQIAIGNWLTAMRQPQSATPLEACGASQLIAKNQPLTAIRKSQHHCCPHTRRALHADLHLLQIGETLHNGKTESESGDFRIARLFTLRTSDPSSGATQEERHRA
jgi:hypothetical protein